ncbi:aminoglycoside phosphotransferase family protein [Prauserella halophila]|uniref:Aminoglycoside phosphotransferase family protein n=1 Tax=Prauserella halophila TaxID=185641 RepID=A0ABN1W5X2_9PSEU
MLSTCDVRSRASGDTIGDVARPLTSAEEVLTVAADEAGLDVTAASLIRDGSNVMYRLQGRIVARVGPTGTGDIAARQIDVSRWLASSGVTVVRALDEVPQPTVVDGRPVTWWYELPEHRPATTAELGAVLREVHALRAPDQLELPRFDPLSGVAERIAAADHVPGDDRACLGKRVEDLRGRLAKVATDGRDGVVHGDAWQGNVAVPVAGGPPILLDLEHVSRGYQDWDLIPVAVDHTDFARVSRADYEEFVTAYGGHDVTTTAAFRVLADSQELRWVAFVLGKAVASAQAARETRHRIACLRGQVDRPWFWTAF